MPQKLSDVKSNLLIVSRPSERTIATRVLSGLKKKSVE